MIGHNNKQIDITSLYILAEVPGVACEFFLKSKFEEKKYQAEPFGQLS